MEQNKLSNSNKFKIVVLAILIFALTVSGVTYAYFTTHIQGNDTASSMHVTTAFLSLIYTDVQIAAGEDMRPGWIETKTLTVENEGNDSVYYNIIWRELYNELTNDELVIEATCVSNIPGNYCESIHETIVPTELYEAENLLIKRNILIEPEEIHTYTLTVTFKETGSLQNYNRGKEFYGTINISEGAEYHPLYNVMKTLAEEGTYASTYSGVSNDTYGVDGTKTIYYIRTSTSNDTTQANELINNKMNVKFAGFCWQMLRTTDTGGIKLIYNGEFTEGTGCKAQDTTDTHKGMIASTTSNTSFKGDYLYSDRFTYDTSTSQFTLVDPVSKNWNNASDKEYILGKYSCKNVSSSCSTLYFIAAPHRTTVNNVWYTSYTIGDTQNAQIGTTSFNPDRYSPAYVGYRFGDVYEWIANSAPSSTDIIMGRDVYWNGSNYVLKDGENDSTYTYTGTQDANYHYTCNTTSATCTDGKVRYYHYGNHYVELTGGDKIEDAISKMITNASNTRDSALKAYLENWYYNNIYGTSSEDYIDQGAVYCNDRSIYQLGGWSSTGPIATTSTSHLRFRNYSTVNDLNCANSIDKFSVLNTTAQLNYPIGVASKAEMNFINNANIRKTGQAYMLISPNYFDYDYAGVVSVNSSGNGSTNNWVYSSAGARPVITIAPANVTLSGTGSLSNPYEFE